MSPTNVVDVVKGQYTYKGASSPNLLSRSQSTTLVFIVSIDQPSNMSVYVITGVQRELG